MGRVTIKRDEQGNVMVLGKQPKDNGFFEYALGKVLSGKFIEISWEPISWEPIESKGEA